METDRSPTALRSPLDLRLKRFGRRTRPEKGKRAIQVQWASPLSAAPRARGRQGWETSGWIGCAACCGSCCRPGRGRAGAGPAGRTDELESLCRGAPPRRGAADPRTRARRCQGVDREHRPHRGACT
jgi:hypothetical protein